MKTSYRVIVGDFNQVHNFEEEQTARKCYNAIPKGDRPSKFRTLEKIETLETDDY